MLRNGCDRPQHLLAVAAPADTGHSRPVGRKRQSHQIRKISETTAITGQSWLAALLLLTLVGLAYANSLEGTFVYDDIPAILDNGTIRDFFSFQWLAGGPADTSVSGRPVVNWTLAINYALGGEDPYGYHLFNIGIHTANSLLLYLLVLTLLGRRGADPSKGRWLALGGAALWAVHPLGTQAVTYVIQRAESMSAFFLLLFLTASAWGWEKSGRHWTWVALASCGLGMATKETMVVAPLLLALQDGLFYGGSWKERWAERRVIYTGSVLCWGLLAFLITTGTQSGETAAGEHLSPWLYLASQTGVIVHYLKLIFWPASLCFDYAWPVEFNFSRVLLPGTFLVAALAVSVRATWKRRAWAYPLTAFFLLLAPTSSILALPDLAVEHRMYLPSATVLILSIILLRAIWLRLGIPPWTLWPPITILIVVLVLATRARNEVYHSPGTLWTDVLSKRPGNARAMHNLGQWEVDQGRTASGLRLLDEAIEVGLPPNYLPSLHYNRGNALMDLGRLEEATASFTRAIEAQPDLVAAYVNRALIALERNRLQDALNDLQQAHRLNPSEAQPCFLLAATYHQMGDNRQAGHFFRKGTSLGGHPPRELESILSPYR